MMAISRRSFLVTAFLASWSMAMTTIARADDPPTYVKILSPGNSADLVGGSHQSFAIKGHDDLGRINYIRLTITSTGNPPLNHGTWMSETSTNATFDVTIPDFPLADSVQVTATAEILDIDMNTIGTDTKTYTVVNLP